MARKLAVTDEAELAAPETPPEPSYTLGTWCGIPRWQCLKCPWDTVESEAVMLAHLAERHAPPPPPSRLIQAYDQYGNPIETPEAPAERTVSDGPHNPD